MEHTEAGYILRLKHWATLARLPSQIEQLARSVKNEIRRILRRKCASFTKTAIIGRELTPL